MAVNRIRYIRRYHRPAYAVAYRAAVVLSELLRLGKADRRGVLRAVLNEDSWDLLPHATRDNESAADPLLYEDFPAGAVIIPAHNEASVIGRTLGRLAPLAAGGQVEVIVACNGCTDNTAEVARGFKGVGAGRSGAFQGCRAECCGCRGLPVAPAVPGCGHRDHSRALRRSSTSSDVGLCWPLVPPFASTRKAPAGSCAPFTGQGTEFPRRKALWGAGSFRSFPRRAQTVRQVPIHFATIQR